MNAREADGTVSKVTVIVEEEGMETRVYEGNGVLFALVEMNDADDGAATKVEMKYGLFGLYPFSALLKAKPQLNKLLNEAVSEYVCAMQL